MNCSFPMGPASFLGIPGLDILLPFDFGRFRLEEVMSEEKWAVRFEDTRQSLTVKDASRAFLRDRYLSLAGALASKNRDTFTRCLYLHSVFDDQVNPFRNLLMNLQKLGTFIDTSTLFEISSGKRSPTERMFHLSFDDGFDNNYRNAFPVLEELGIKAAFFVASSYMETPDHVIRENWWSSDPLPIRTMNWSWIREMHEAGHEIGSHTRTHARLSSVSADADELASQLRGSKQEVEDRLGVECRYFAWPYGTMADVDEVSLDGIRDAGYEGCFSAVRGRVEPGRTDPMCVPRHHFEPDWPWYHVRYFAFGGKE